MHLVDLKIPLEEKKKKVIQCIYFSEIHPVGDKVFILASTSKATPYRTAAYPQGDFGKLKVSRSTDARGADALHLSIHPFISGLIDFSVS